MNKYPSDKPIMVIQTHGGAPQQETKYSWARDIPMNIIKGVVNEFHKDYTIFHIRRDDQFAVENTIQLSDNFKAMASVIQRSQKRFFMDSFAQHTAAALGLKSTVLWVANKPSVFGYGLHDNIVANPETAKPDLRNSFLQKYNIAGALQEFPYNNEDEIFNLDIVLESLMNQ